MLAAADAPAPIAAAAEPHAGHHGHGAIGTPAGAGDAAPSADPHAGHHVWLPPPPERVLPLLPRPIRTPGMGVTPLPAR